MIDLNKIEELQDEIRAAIKNKGLELDFDHFLELHKRRDLKQKEVERLRQVRNELSEKIARAQDKDALLQESRKNNIILKQEEDELNKLLKEWEFMAATLPGLPNTNTPIGKDEYDNVELKRYGRIPLADEKPLDHLGLAATHNMVDFDGARQIAGSRAYALRGWGALLEIAALRFAYDYILKKGFEPVAPPLMVRENAMFGTGYFPVGRENAYELTKDDVFLTGTAEVGLVALHAGKTFKADELPLRMVGMSTCFRREAGAAGKDTRGLYRVHQFQKVEQVVFCLPDDELAQEEHNNLLQNSEEILQALELPYRVVECCTGELGLGQHRKFDIETWMPGRNAFGETHSCSNLKDFQARRLKLRVEGIGNEKRFLYTLNNTAIASPRILVALMENHQDKDGNILIPKALQCYMGGLEAIERKK